MIRSIEFRAMNTTVLMAAEGADVIDGLQVAKQFLEDCEQRFSRFLPESEISMLNRSAGHWQVVSPDLMEMLLLSQAYSIQTHGIFDPSILTDLKRIGYDQSMDVLRVSGPAAQASASSRTRRASFLDVELDPANQKIFLPPSLEIDLGGIAKAWIVDKTARLLAGYAEACAVSAGGDMLFIGHPADGLDWDVLLEDPRDPAQVLTQLHVSCGAVATSSITRRAWQQAGKARHHLIDPRTGEPAVTDWLSVTVVAPGILDAEIYAKTLLIGGTAEVNMVPASITYLAVDHSGALLGSPHFKDYLYENSQLIYYPHQLTG